MATKRSPIRRRHIGGNAEYKAWREAFETGNDGFNELSEFGIVDPVNRIVPVAEMPAARAAFKEQMADAWKRFGARFIAEWTPTDTQQLPAAYREFGAP
ncbi:hypothetical protein [Mesorhizobium silamurunense]|uniref:hypothetical protein n=1 Tax=Mesorhizobium silamurunense TaxID=499528 RepID=UPI001781C021|nr:hypothetical protein [Mesorhizobium silamurunense]